MSRSEKAFFHPLIWIVLVFAVLFGAVYNLISQQKSAFSISANENPIQSWLKGGSVELIPNGIVITADRQGHYTGQGLINGKPMNFMIDTGATLVAVPADLAKKADLAYGMAITSKTAAGEVKAYQTVIPELSIGNITMQNIRAVIHYQLDDVLIGMTVLKKFRVTQFDGKMQIEMLSS